MSAIAGIYHLDRRPIDRPLLGRMLDCVPQWGSDAVRVWTDAFIGLGHRQLCVTEESFREVQPACNRMRTHRVTFDGRIDNRQDLIRRLRPAPGAFESPTDVDLLLIAYEVWGTDCLKWIIGDFAFALWDSQEQHLFCGRDTYGIRPFYYHFDGTAFTFGSDIFQIFQNPSISRDIDKGKIAEWFTWCGIQGHTYRDLNRTFFRDIRELPFAHSLIVKSSGLKLNRYWDIDPNFQVRYRRQDEYAEHFAQVFRESVRCRLRSAGPIGTELSGGFDSSSVVCTAQEIYRTGEIKQNKFVTFSMVFDELSCDERPLIKTVIDKYQLDSRYIVADNLCGLQNFPLKSDATSGISNPNQFVLQQGAETLYKNAAAENIRVMLSGEGAENHLLGTQFVLDSLARKLALGELFERLKVLRWQSSLRSALNELIRYGVIPLLPKRISKPIYLKWFYPFHNSDFGNLFSSDFAGILEEEIGKQKTQLAKFSTFDEWGRQMEYEALNPGNPVLGMPVPLPIERRFPYHDRRLVEFCLAIPPEQKYEHMAETGRRSVRGRRLQRYGLQGILPEEIRRSQIKVNFSDVYKRRFGQFKDAYLQMFAPPVIPLVATLGIVEPKTFSQLLSNSLDRIERSEELYPFVKLWINRITLLEIWLGQLRSLTTAANAGSYMPVNKQSDRKPCSDFTSALMYPSR